MNKTIDINGYEHVQRQLEDCLLAVRRLQESNRRLIKTQNIDTYLEKEKEEINNNFDHDLVKVQQFKNDIVKDNLIEYLNDTRDKQIKRINKIDKYLGYMKSNKKIKPENKKRNIDDEEEKFYVLGKKNTFKKKKYNNRFRSESSLANICELNSFENNDRFRSDSLLSEISEPNRSRNNSDEEISTLKYKVRKYMNLLRIKKKNKKEKEYGISYGVNSYDNDKKKCSIDSDEFNTEVNEKLQILNSVYDLYTKLKDGISH